MSMRYLTTGQVAHICGVAHRTVANWADKGMLKCSKIPGSLHRRFVVSDVMAFIDQHGIVAVDMPSTVPITNILCYDVAEEFTSQLKYFVCKENGYNFRIVDGTVAEAGFAMHAHDPRVLLLGEAGAELLPLRKPTCLVYAINCDLPNVQTLLLPRQLNLLLGTIRSIREILLKGAESDS